MSEKTITEARLLVDPPAALISRNPVQWFRFFGPGAIAASITIGSGETLFASRGGSIFGYDILWVFLWIALLKWVLVYGSVRHIVLSGGHPFERWTELPGPRGWFPLFMVLTAVFCWPFWTSFLAGLLGTACTWTFGIGDYYWWATGCLTLIVLLLSVGGYNFLEKSLTILIGLKLAAILAALFYLRPDLWDLAKNLILPHKLAYPDWALEKLPDLQQRSAWLEIMVYISAIGGASHDYLAYVSWIREKSWGWSHLGQASAAELAQTASQKDHPARLWLRAAQVDTITSFALVVIFSAAFSVLGTLVLRPEQLVPDGTDLLNYQGKYLETLAHWLLPLYKVGIFCVFFGMLYGGQAMCFRVIYEYLITIERWRTRVPNWPIRWPIMAWSIGGGIIILWISKLWPEIKPIDIVTLPSIFTGVLSCGFYCLVNPWMDRRFLPQPLRMNRPLAIWNYAAAILFFLIGFKGLWDYGMSHFESWGRYGGWGGFVMLAVFTLLCFLAAHAVRNLRKM